MTSLWGVAGNYNGSFVAAAGDDGQLFLWAPMHVSKTGITAPMLSVRAHDRAKALAFLDVDDFVSGGVDGYIRKWRVGTGPAGDVVGEHASTVMALAFSTDRKFLAACDEDGAVVVRQWDNAKVVATWKYKVSVTDVAFSQNGKLIATVDSTGVVQVGAADGSGRKRVDDKERGGMGFACAWLDNDQLVFTKGGALFRWTKAAGATLLWDVKHAIHSCIGVAVDRGRRRIAVTLADKVYLMGFDGKDVRTCEGHESTAHRVCHVGEGVFASTDDGGTVVLHGRDGETLMTLTT